MADPWFISFLFFISIFLPVVVVYFAYKHEEPVCAPRCTEIGMPLVTTTAALTSQSPRTDWTRRRRLTKNQEPTVGDLGPRSTVPPNASDAIVSSDRPSRRRRGGAKTRGEASASGGVPSLPDLAEQRMIVQEICEVGLEKDVDMEGGLDVLCSQESLGRKEDKRVEIGRGSDDLSKDEEGGENEGELVVEPIEGDAKGKINARELSETRGASLLQCDDEWEGIELSDVEKLFRVATQFADANKGKDAVSRLSNELQMQLYGLRKVAIEGPCYEPQPMALKVSSRSKWHAWQRLGNMNPEVAMELYIRLLTGHVPEWIAEKSSEDIVSGINQNEPKSWYGLYKVFRLEGFQYTITSFPSFGCSLSSADLTLLEFPGKVDEGLDLSNKDWRMILSNLILPPRIKFDVSFSPCYLRSFRLFHF